MPFVLQLLLYLVHCNSWHAAENVLSFLRLNNQNNIEVILFPLTNLACLYNIVLMY